MVDVTLDPFFSCGQTRWGVKNWQNQSGTGAVFGRNNSCGSSGAGTIVDRTNYIKVTTKNGTSFQGAWQAGIQGTDPWAVKDTDGSQPAVNHNTVMPLSSGLFYQLEVQYLWYRSPTSKPASSTANVMANMLVNFWFGDKTKKVVVGGKTKYKDALVIDFCFACLKNSAGVWVIDSSKPEGSLFATPHKDPQTDPDLSGGYTYHYGPVLDDDGINDGQWYAPPTSSYYKTITNIITDAFNYSYPGGSPTQSNYELVDVEVGAEIWSNKNTTPYDVGTLVGAFSLCKVTYT